MFRHLQQKVRWNACRLYFGFISMAFLADLTICKPFETLQLTSGESAVSMGTGMHVSGTGTDLEMLVDHWMTADDELEQRYRRDLEADLTDIDIRVSVMKRATRSWMPWQLNRDICPPSLCSFSDESGSARPRPRGTGGTIFYNGDIVLDEESESIIYSNSYRQRWRRRKRATMRSSRLWPGGVVPYMFPEEIAPKSKKVILRAMKNIEKNTCIKFRRKKSRDDDYVRFISEPGCWSNVGRVGGEQRLSIGRGCERLGTAIHEISHVLGFWHEQARPDRDKYIQIVKDNISPRYLPDFDKANTTLVSSRGYPYDYESVMHYSKKAFTNLGDDTIKVIGVGKKLKMKIGQREALSTIDIAQLRDMYHCNDKEDINQTHCPDGWRKQGRSCYKFESTVKEQFAGAQRLCEKLRSRLLSIDDSKEDRYIRRHIRKKFPDVKSWRTGGRIVNGTFVWYQGEGRDHKEMAYEKWPKDHPSTYSSMALVQEKPGGKVKWQGVWLGSAKQMPDHAYAVICERRARRKCIKGSHADGRDYRGTLDHTIEGITCQKWSSQYPHSHDLLPYPYNSTQKTNDGLGDHNRCRNPPGQRRSRPWCFTTKDKFTWQYCDVTICSGSLAPKDEPQAPNRKQEPRDLKPGANRKNSGGNRKRDQNAGNGTNKRGENKKDKANNKNSVDKKNNRNKKDKKNTKPDSKNNNTEKTNRKENNGNKTDIKVQNEGKKNNNRKGNSNKSSKTNRTDKARNKKGNGSTDKDTKGQKDRDNKRNKNSRAKGSNRNPNAPPKL